MGARAGDPRYRNGKLADPEFRRERARKAAVASNSVDARINALIRSAPALTLQQAAKLRALLPPVAGEREGADDAAA